MSEGSIHKEGCNWTRGTMLEEGELVRVLNDCFPLILAKSKRQNMSRCDSRVILGVSHGYINGRPVEEVEAGTLDIPRLD